MSSCEEINNLVLDKDSLKALERIRKKKFFGNFIALLATAGVFANIFTKSKPAQVAYNITQNDWELYAEAMTAMPAITKHLIDKEIELMILHYSFKKQDRKHLLFWKGLYDGCK